MIAAAAFAHQWFMWRLFLSLASALGMHVEPSGDDGEVLIWTGRDEVGVWVA